LFNFQSKVYKVVNPENELLEKKETYKKPPEHLCFNVFTRGFTSGVTNRVAMSYVIAREKRTS